MVIDLSNYKDRMGAHVFPGRYRVQVEDVEAEKSKAGNPMINLWYRIIGGEFDGQVLIDRITITEKSLFRVVGFMNAIGLPTPKKQIKVNPQRFLGQVLDVEVDDGEPYNGRVKSEVRGYLRVPASERSGGAQEEPEFEGGDVSEFASTTTSNPSAEAPAPAKAAADDAADADADEPVDLDELDL